jgi:hypothetical protein
MVESIKVYFDVPEGQVQQPCEAEVAPRLAPRLSKHLPDDVVYKLEGEIPWPGRSARVTGRLLRPSARLIETLKRSAGCAVFIGAWRYRLYVKDDGTFEATEW